MPDSGESISVTVFERIAEIPAATWDACAGTANPFTTHAFLLALEESGSATGAEGWQPSHLVAEDACGRVLGVVPAYLKSHSYGEYVFDWGWAQAYERAGGRYYPKIQVAVPFTPVTGRRLLLRDPDDQASAAALIVALQQLATRARASSVHATFIADGEVAAFRAAGWLIREGFQYHWDNRGYGSFEDFLAQLSHGKRKSIRKERRGVAAQGISLERLTGEAITAAHWDAFYRFYISTSDRKWGNPYLTRDFFHRLGSSLGDRVVLVMASHRGKPVAGALNLVGEDVIYGRNWGCRGSFPHLHFEACYYQAIDHAIAHGLARVEAGAQGEHKLQRGYLPRPTWSAHWVRDPSFRAAIDRYLCQETPLIEAEREALGEHSPFKRDD